MARPSLYLSGALPPCPERFNAAALWLDADVPDRAQARLASCKLAREVIAVKSPPHSVNGKLLRRDLPALKGEPL